MTEHVLMSYGKMTEMKSDEKELSITEECSSGVIFIIQCKLIKVCFHIWCSLTV